MEEIKISSEEQAFSLLEKALQDQLGDKPFILKFDNWPILQIKLEGEGYDSTITPDMAQALIEIQRAINRTYARTVHNSLDARGLSSEERQNIQLKAKVKSGSSLVEVNFGDFAEKLSNMVVGKMTPEMLTITVLGVVIVGASLLAYKSFLKGRSADKQIEQEARTRISLSQEETKRLDVLAQAMRQVPALGQARDDFDAARNQIISATGDATRLTVNDLPIDNATARTLSTTRRSESQEVQMNGNYLITAVDLRRPDEIRLRVQNSADGSEFLASFQDHSLEHEQIKLLQDAEWLRHQVYLSINARILRGAVTVATVVSVKIQPPVS